MSTVTVDTTALLIRLATEAHAINPYETAGLNRVKMMADVILFLMNELDAVLEAERQAKAEQDGIIAEWRAKRLAGEAA